MTTKKTTKPVETEEVEISEEELEKPDPKANKKCRVVGLYDGQTIDRTYEDADVAKQFCDKINISGRNNNKAELV